jgi:hypothetical protein
MLHKSAATRLVGSIGGLLLLGGLLAGCSGKVEAKAGNEGLDASAKFGDDHDVKWDGDDDAGGAQGGSQSDAKGRLVEGHAWDTRPLATLPGFRQFDDGSSRVFLELTGEVDVKERPSERLLVYRFEGVGVPERVNTLTLPTSHFQTPVTLVSVKRVDGAAELHVHLRQPVKPSAHLKRTPAGTVLSLDFPVYKPHAQDTQVNVAKELKAADAADKKK